TNTTQSFPKLENKNTRPLSNTQIHMTPHIAAPSINTPLGPDIVLTNTQTFHNMRLDQGPLTPSDHIPIIATITANPIQIPIRPRPSFHHADWTQYKDRYNTKTGHGTTRSPADPRRDR
ncbi:hypothetical protein FHG87_024419, partial [Trinorchestia longiramus]